MIDMNDNLNDILVAYLKYILVMNGNLTNRYEWFVVSSFFNLHDNYLYFLVYIIAIV
jgi:hypothetical protein